jgi:hypothetical protein
MLIRSLVALSLSSVALLAGCGDDEPSAAAPSTPAPVVQPTTTTTPAVVAEEPAEPKKSKKKKAAKGGNAPEWVVVVNARCKQYQKQATDTLNKFQASGATSPAAAAEAMNSVIPLGRQLVTDLRPVDVPADVQDDWTTFLDTLNGAFDLMPQIAKSMSGGQPDPELMKKFAEVEKNTRPFADQYGLSECLSA